MIVLGIDIGKKSDPSALVRVKGVASRPDRIVTHCSRLPLGMAYPDQISLMAQQAEHADMTVIDGSGVGEAVVDGVRKQLVGKDDIWSLVITGGKQARMMKTTRSACIPKPSMIWHLAALLDQERLKLASEAHDLVDELRSFRHRSGKMEAKIGEHDDLLMALCMALMGFKIRELVG